MAWYISGEDGKSEGPYSAEQISERLRKGQIPGSTLCWREGMPEWCQLSTVELFASEPAPGRAALAGENESDVIWYIPGQDDQSAGPYSTDQIFEWLNTNQIPSTTLCWRQGMSKWRPLTAVRPFSHELRRRMAGYRKKMYRRIIAISSVICAIVAGVIVYSIIMGPPEVRSAKKLMASRLYTPAVRVLEQYLKRNPLDDKASYLLAIAKINQYAADKSVSVVFFRDSAEVREILLRVFKANSKWKKRARKDIAKAVKLIPVTAVDGFNRNLEISLLRAELNLADNKQLARELLDKLEAQGDLQSNYNSYQDAILEILGWNSSLGRRLVWLMLGGENASRLHLSDALETLQYWAGQRPAFAKVLSTELLNLAESHYAGGDDEQAKMLLFKALEVNPEAVKTEGHAFLCILLMEPNDAKLTRCELFLRDYPDSFYCPDVRITILRDAVAVSKQYDLWSQAEAELYLSAGLSEAKELISRCPERPDLDIEVMELAKSMAERKKFREAIGLAFDLLEAVPDLTGKLQITQAIAQWRLESGEGNLSPELAELAERVKKELEPKTVSLLVPTAVQVLTAEDAAVRVIQVADECTADKFNSEQADTLRRWVSEGGILWANNDVLSLFNINYGVGAGGVMECEPASVSEDCHILAGCSNVVVSKESPAVYNLNCRNIILLLTTGEGAGRHCCWSLVPYGEGWVSDVKTVDVSKHDGARFQLNFRLFCLGWDIPGATGKIQVDEASSISRENVTRRGIEPPASDIGLPAKIISAVELEKLLAGGDSQKVIWISLSRDDIDVETRRKLRSWVSRGGVLWVETNLAVSFGFKGLRRVESNSLSGRAEIAIVQDPVVVGMSGQKVNYELAPNGMMVSGKWSEIQQSMRPLLVEVDARTNLMKVFCAVVPYGEGFVVLRPAKIETTSTAGQTFESRLLSFDSGSEMQTPAPESRRRRPGTMRRRRQ